MIYFGIPLRSKQVSRNWDSVCRIFERTLHSIYNQTDPNFRIFVACHEIPELHFPVDERVQFLVSDSPIPRDTNEMMLDKGWKISMIGMEIRKLGGGYTMLVDADDLVSNKIAAYAEAHPNENGFVSQNGYVYNEGTDYAKKLLALHRICGSCSIVNYAVEDLPDRMPADLWDDSLRDQYVLRMPHREVPDHMAKIGRPLAQIPFPITMYVRNTGDNHSMFNGGDLNWKRQLEMMVKPRVSLRGPVGVEFGFCDAWEL